MDELAIALAQHQEAAQQKFAFNSSLLDQGLPKGGNYSRSTTVLIPWSLRVDTRSKGGVGCVLCGLGKG